VITVGFHSCIALKYYRIAKVMSFFNLCIPYKWFEKTAFSIDGNPASMHSEKLYNYSYIQSQLHKALMPFLCANHVTNNWSQLRSFSLNSLLKCPNDMQETNRTLPILTFPVDLVKLLPAYHIATG